jgi:hypothetical protein
VPASVLVSFLAAPVLWAMHLAVSYFLVALDYTTAWNGGRLAVGLATALFAAACAGGGLYAWRAWRRTRDTMLPGELLDPTRTRGFLVLSGAVMAGPFTLMIVLAGLAPFFAPMCR